MIDMINLLYFQLLDETENRQAPPARVMISYAEKNNKARECLSKVSLVFRLNNSYYKFNIFV
jgi:hypothetical protein